MPKAIGGMSIGADPITSAVVVMSAVRNTPLVGFLVRKQAKGHGTNQFVEGRVRRGDSVAIVEDVVTTGGSSLAAIERVEAFGLKVQRVSPSSTAWKAGPRPSPKTATSFQPAYDPRFRDRTAEAKRLKAGGER